MNARSRVILKLLETERSYVNDLNVLVSVFMKPLKAQLEVPGKPDLDKVEISAVFSIVDQLVNHISRVNGVYIQPAFVIFVI